MKAIEQYFPVVLPVYYAVQGGSYFLRLRTKSQSMIVQGKSIKVPILML